MAQAHTGSVRVGNFLHSFVSSSCQVLPSVTFPVVYYAVQVLFQVEVLWYCELLQVHADLSLFSGSVSTQDLTHPPQQQLFSCCRVRFCPHLTVDLLWLWLWNLYRSQSSAQHLTSFFDQQLFICCMVKCCQQPSVDFWIWYLDLFRSQAFAQNWTHVCVLLPFLCCRVLSCQQCITLFLVHIHHCCFTTPAQN